MLTMPMPMTSVCDFDVVNRTQKQVRHVDAGLTFAEGMNQLIRGPFLTFHISGSLRAAVHVQDELIEGLQSPAMQDLPAEKYVLLAEQIELLVSVSEHIVAIAKEFDRRSWRVDLERLHDQAVHLASIAESFRFASDVEAVSMLSSIANDVTETPSEQRVVSMQA